MMNRRNLLISGLAVPLIAAKRAPPGVDWNGWFKDWLLRDFGMIGYYAEDNAKVLASRAPVEIVFLGDSITEGWMDKRPSFFRRGMVNRGISGQTSAQMLVRMMSDVVELKPKAVHIMAGTNDIAGNTGPMTARMTQDNLRAMVDIAARHHIRVLLASIPPAASFPWRPGMDPRPPIADLNRWIRQFAHDSRCIFIDYWAALEDGRGAMKSGLSSDGVHPTEKGYDVMDHVLEPILARMVPREVRL